MPKMAVTPVLLALNVAIFGLMLAWGIHPMQPAIDDLIRWGANYGPKTTQGEWWRMFTCMFLHIGLLHLLFNMVALWNVGGFMERLLGSTGFLVLYVVAGLLGSVASVAWNPFVISAGASGAIFGLLGAGLILEFEATGRLAGNYLTLIIVNLVFTFAIPGISIGGHIGGLIGGIVGALVLTRFGRGRARTFADIGALHTAGLIAIGVVSVVIAYWRVRGLA